MITKRTIVDQIEVTRSGAVQIRLGLLMLEDGQELDCKWHRTAVEPGGDVAGQFAAVNTHLQSMGKLPVSAQDIQRVTEIAEAAWRARG